LPSRVLLAEQSNTSILYDNKFFFKLYRAPEEGNNPELEIIRTLTENTSFRNFPTFAGALEYESENKENMGLGISWSITFRMKGMHGNLQSAIDHYFDRIIEEKDELMAANYGKHVAEDGRQGKNDRFDGGIFY
jgi:maltose alpha-D-glucosyltransferase / alpha-amylase